MLIRTLFLVIALLAAAHAPAQETPMDPGAIARLKKGVEESASRTSTITANFTQEKEMSILDEKIRSTGKFYFKKEKMLRWEYLQPYSYIIVINNDRITIRDDKKTSHFDSGNKVFAEINRIIVGSIRGTLLDDTQNFSASYFTAPNAFVVKLIPLSQSLRSSLKEINLFFNKNDFSVDRLEMNENTGDRTVILFSGKKFNEPLTDEKFILR